MWISRREYERLMADLERERERADREQHRADEAVNQIMLEAGRSPLPSGPAQSGQREMSLAAKSMLAQIEADAGLREGMFEDGDDSEPVDADGFMRIAPEAVAAVMGVR